MKTSRSAQAVRYVILGTLSLVFLLPFYVIVRNAFSTQKLITSAQWQWLPDAWNLTNLTSVLGNPDVPVLHSLMISAVVSLSVTVLTLLISLQAGYALARYDGRLARTLLALTVLTLMVPATVTFIPSFVMVSSLGWISDLRGLIIPTIFSAFATYLFRQYFLDFPVELEEAAFIDGANHWQVLWRVVAPNSTGIVAAVGTITFIGSWNSFLWPMLIGQDDATRTIQVTLSRYMTSQGIKYPELFCGALISLIPTLLMFLLLQRWLVQGVASSGLK